ncbi:MAG: hypothetical protein KTR30_11195 [Saprospiraceae bacterium]|nr:hypothetical protein [Saprospiraceae bacterium]
MNRKLLLYILTLLALPSCVTTERSLFECPFDLLQIQQETYYSADESKLFLTEFESTLNALNKKIVGGEIRSKASASLKDVLTRFESKVFGGDSLFISYYNGLANNICMLWRLYEDRPDDRNRNNLEQSIRALQDFVTKYYDQGRPSQGALDEIQVLLGAIRKLKSELQSYISRVDYARSEEIRLENYSRKLSYLELKLEQLNSVDLNQNDLHLITEVRMKFDPLAKEIEAEMN